MRDMQIMVNDEAVFVLFLKLDMDLQEISPDFDKVMRWAWSNRDDTESYEREFSLFKRRFRYPASPKKEKSNVIRYGDRLIVN